MVKYIAVSLVFCIFKSAASQAADLKSICHAKNSTCLSNNYQQTPIILQTALQACELVTKSQFCIDLEKNEPEFLGKLKKCTPEKFCEDYLIENSDLLKNCTQGYLEGTGEAVHHLLESLKEPSRFASECEPNINCKKELVQNNPKYAQMSDTDLNKFSAAFLIVEKNNFDYITSTYQRQNLRISSLYDQAVKAERANSNRKNISTEDANAQTLFSITKSWLEKKKARLECLDKQTQAEMICWGAAYIANPATVASLGLKGFRMAKIVSNFGEEKSLSLISTNSRQTLEKAKSKPNAVDIKTEKIESELRNQMSASGIDATKLKANVNSVWNNNELTIDKKISLTFDEYYKARRSNLTTERKELADSALQNIERPKNTEIQQYDPRNGKISIGEIGTSDPVVYHQILAHELEHLGQVGLYTPTNKTITEKLSAMMKKNTSSKYQNIRFEFEAIGAQWDFLQSIPKEIRLKSIQSVQNDKRMSAALKKALIDDLRMAELSREDYIKVVPKSHSYTVRPDVEFERTARLATIGSIALLGGVTAYEAVGSTGK